MTQQSYNSQIEIITQNGDKWVDKTFAKGMNRKEADELMQKVLLQRKGLEDIHVPVSELVNIDVSKKEDEYVVNIRENYAGSDFLDVVNEENLQMYLDKLLKDIYKPLLTSSKEKNLKVGIDPVLRNFVYDIQRKRFVYVDFIPAKVYYRGQYSQEIPELTDPDFKDIRMICHYDRAGIVYVTYINLVREYPGAMRIVAAMMEHFLQSIDQIELFSYISSSPIYRAVSEESVKDIVESIPDWKGLNYFRLREIANWLNFQDPDFTNQKKKIYKLSHHITDKNDPEYGKVSSKNFKEMKKILLSKLSHNK